MALRASQLTGLERQCVLRFGVKLKVGVMTGVISWQKPGDSWASIGYMSCLVQYMLIPSFQYHMRSSFWSSVKLALETLPLDWKEELKLRISFIGEAPSRRASKKLCCPEKSMLPPREKSYFFFSASVHIEFWTIGPLDSNTSIDMFMWFQLVRWVFFHNSDKRLEDCTFDDGSFISHLW